MWELRRRCHRSVAIRSARSTHRQRPDDLDSLGDHQSSMLAWTGLLSGCSGPNDHRKYPATVSSSWFVVLRSTRRSTMEHSAESCSDPCPCGVGDYETTRRNNKFANASSELR